MARDQEGFSTGDLSAAASRNPEFVTICAWTNRVRWRGSWVSFERFLRERFGIQVTHGISSEAISALNDDQPAVDPRS